MSPELTIQLCILVPFVGAAAIPLVASSPNLREAVTLVTGAVLFY